MSKANVMTVQISPQIGHKQNNLEKVRNLIEENSYLNPDLVVMPEFFNTGVSVPAFKKLAEPVDNNETVAFFKDIARQYKTYILVGSIIERENDKLYNTSRLLDRNGEEVAFYRKIHLFDSFGGEEYQYCEPGNEYVVVDTDFGKLGLSVCFDIKFPLQYIELVKRGAEIIVDVAAWSNTNECLADDIERWILINKARAVDNLAYFVTSNLCGKIDSTLSSCGHSMITGPSGKVLAALENEEGIAFAQLDTEELKKYRSQFKMENLWRVV